MRVRALRIKPLHTLYHVCALHSRSIVPRSAAGASALPPPLLSTTLECDGAHTYEMELVHECQRVGGFCKHMCIHVCVYQSAASKEGDRAGRGCHRPHHAQRCIAATIRASSAVAVGVAVWVGAAQVVTRMQTGAKLVGDEELGRVFVCLQCVHSTRCSSVYCTSAPVDRY